MDAAQSEDLEDKPQVYPLDEQVRVYLKLYALFIYLLFIFNDPCVYVTEKSIFE